MAVLRYWNPIFKTVFERERRQSGAAEAMITPISSLSLVAG